MIQVPPMCLTGAAGISWRKVMVRFSRSSVRREVHSLAWPLAVAQMWMRSWSPSASVRSTWMVGGKMRGQLVTSASSW